MKAKRVQSEDLCISAPSASKEVEFHRRAPRGFSLIELAMVLAILGVTGLALWKLTASLRPAAQSQPAEIQLAEASQALEGFILARHRLPCPDLDGDGNENCGAEAIGTLPAGTLGLPRASALRYGVYRRPNAVDPVDADLAAVKDRYQPLLPPGTTSAVQNGLDFCAALRNAAGAPGALTAGGASGVPVAYALAHPGAGDADGSGGPFDGLNATGFELPSRALDESYDDRVFATGLTELAARLGCPQRLAAANAAARSAYAAYDEDRYAAMYQRFRVFGSAVRETDVAFDAALEAMAVIDLATATATGITAVALGLVSNASTGPEVAGALFSVTLAVAALAAQSAKLAMSVVALETAKEQKNAADTYKTQTAQWATQAASAALQADAKGLLP